MSNLLKSTVLLMLATIVSKVLGFAREMVLASSYGASMYSDAYITAQNVPALLFVSVASAISIAVTPMYYDVKNTKGERAALKYLSNVVNITGLVALAIIALGLLFTKPIVKVVALGFEGEALELTVGFVRIMILSVLFLGISNVLTSFLQIKNNFVIPGLIGIPYNIITIAFILLSVNSSPYLLAYGILLATAGQFLFQVPFARRKGYRYMLHLDIKDAAIKKTLWLVGPVFIGVAVNQVNTLIDRTLASTLVEGSISALNYANRLTSLVMGLFIVSIGAVIYPVLSKLSSEDDKGKFIEVISTSINSVVLLVTPISVGAIVLATPLVRLLFQRGEFDVTATSMTAVALVFYSIGMVGFGLRDILGKVFYSLQDTKTPMMNGALAVGLNIVLNLVLVGPMGHAGLALATSMSSILCILLLFASLKKKVRAFGQRGILVTFAKSLIASLVMASITYFLYSYLELRLGVGFVREAASIVLSITTGAIVYGVSLVALRVDGLAGIMNMVKSVLRK